MPNPFLLSIVLLTLGALLVVESAREVPSPVRDHSREQELFLESFRNAQEAREERLSIIAGAWADTDLRQHNRITAALDKHLGGSRIEGH
jgi:hypothetical protein